MRYLGGKSRIASAIAEAISPRGFWWEPFCGGLSVSVQLAKFGPGCVSDCSQALISLYSAIRGGWVPTSTVSRADYEEARELPDTDPRKAFCAFGCSFSGKYFAGYAAESRTRKTRRTGKLEEQEIRENPVRAARASLLRDVPILEKCQLTCVSFFAVTPECFPAPETIYADPPYQNTTGYEGVPWFDHALFWSYCQRWAARGTRVFVSEYECPVPAVEVWSKPQTNRMWSASKQRLTPTERLWLVR